MEAVHSLHASHMTSVSWGTPQLALQMTTSAAAKRPHLLGVLELDALAKDGVHVI